MLDGDGDGTGGDDGVFGDEEADAFFRLLGDGDGDRDVDGQDYGRFGAALFSSALPPPGASVAASRA